MNAHTSTVHSCKFSPDGGRIVSSATDATIRIWDAKSGIELRSIETREQRCHSFLISPDGKFVFFEGLRSFLIWEVETGNLVCEFCHDTGFTARDWSPNSLDLAAGDGLGRFYILRPENISFGPPIVSPWEFESKEGIVAFKRKNLGFGCPVCRSWSKVHKSALGTLISCPNCQASIKLNSFTIKADWRLIAEAWKKNPDGNKIIRKIQP
jgi:WD40 repeat protein